MTQWSPSDSVIAMSLETIQPLFLACFVAALLKGLTGLGFSTLALPVLAWWLEPAAAISLLVLPSLFSNMAVMRQAGDWHGAWQHHWPLYLATLPGLLAGVALLLTIPAAVGHQALGGVLVVYALWSFTRPEWICPARWREWLKAPVGFTTGAVNGLTGSQIMPVLPYLMALDLTREQRVVALNLSFTLSSLVMLGLLGGAGQLSGSRLGLGLLALAPTALGVALGGRLRGRLQEAHYRRGVLGLLLVTGLALLVRG